MNRYVAAHQTMREYHEFVANSAFDPHAGKRNIDEITYLCLGIAGEAGEFIDTVKKLARGDHPEYFGIGGQPTQAFYDSPECAHLIEELGDIQWYLTRTMRWLGVGPYEVMIRNTFKLFERHRERFPDTPWPFSDPFISYDNVKERLSNVRVDEKV